MDGLALLSEATAAGLTVQVDGDRLVIRGPKTADAVARRLLEYKPDVVTALGRLGLTSTELPKPDEPPFPGWIRRPDATGRLGWEPPGLPESRRWWACCTDDELPTWDDLLHGRVTIGRWAGGALYVRTSDGPDGPTGTHAGLAACSWCGRRQWWRSQAWPDVVRCGWCSPPVPGLPVEWLDRSEAGPIEKPVTQEAGCCVSAGSVNV
jgi:hypothetical protein